MTIKTDRDVEEEEREERMVAASSIVEAVAVLATFLDRPTAGNERQVIELLNSAPEAVRKFRKVINRQRKRAERRRDRSFDRFMDREFNAPVPFVCKAG